MRLIPPGAADTIHYRLDIPEDAGDRIQITAKVNYRKFTWWNTQWAYAGVRDPSQPDYSVNANHDTGKWIFTGDTSDVSGAMKEIPNLPVTVMAQATSSLRVVPAPDRRSPPPARSRTRHFASDGMTTASACCCRAIFAAPRRRFSK